MKEMNKWFPVAVIILAMAYMGQLNAKESRSREYRAVIYMTYGKEGRRCAGKEHIGYRVNNNCCPQGFEAIGVREGESGGDAICLQQ